MDTRTPLIASALLAASFISGTAHAALEGRDLNGSTDSFEAYYDTVLEITWLADANYAKTSSYDADGRMTLSQATTWVANLSFYNPTTNKTLAGWRLPTLDPVNGVSFNYGYSFDGSTDVGFNISNPQSELAYMFYVNLSNPGYINPAGDASGCYISFPSNTCLDNQGPFSNLQPDVYWSGLEYAASPDLAWIFVMGEGGQFAGTKDNPYYAWAVRDGDVAAIPEPETYTMMLAGLLLLGVAARRRKPAKV